VALENDSPTLLDDAATVDNRQCVGAWAPTQQSVYGNTDYTGVAAQLLRALNQAAWQDSVTQAVIAFPSQESAGRLYVTQRGQWALCGGKTLTVTTAGQPTQTWDFAQPVTTSGVLTLVAKLRGGAASCQRGMLVRGNVIIDIRQCHPGGNTNVTALVTATAGKVPHQ
jgi:serine/threonine-protein kinase